MVTSMIANNKHFQWSQVTIGQNNDVYFVKPQIDRLDREVMTSVMISSTTQQFSVNGKIVDPVHHNGEEVIAKFNHDPYFALWLVVRRLDYVWLDVSTAVRQLQRTAYLRALAGLPTLDSDRTIIPWAWSLEDIVNEVSLVIDIDTGKRVRHDA